MGVDWGKGVEMDYTEHLYALGLAPSTIRMYRSMMRRAHEWAERTGVDLTDLKATDIASLREEFVESTATLRQVKCALVHWCEMMGVPAPPTKAFRIPKRSRPRWRGLDDADARRLAQEALKWKPEGLAVLIGLYTGLRREEIATMRWDRFTPDLDWYTVTGKGNYTETIAISADLRPILEDHRSAYVYLFPGERRRHVTPATIWDWTRTVSEAAGIGHVRTHQLRHTAVGKVCDNYGIRVAQAFARHADIQTTQIYTAVTDRQKIEAAASMRWLDEHDDEAAA